MNTIYTWKTGLYAISMLISQFFALIRGRRPKASKPLLYLMYFWPRVHLVLINFCLVDICYMATRIILHSRSQIHVAYSLLLIILLFIDIISILSLALNKPVWRKVYNFVVAEEKQLQPVIKGSNPTTPLAKPIDLKLKGTKSSPLASQADSSVSSSRKVQNFSPRIDYDRTYDELDVNHHLVSVSSSSLMISRKVYLS